MFRMFCQEKNPKIMKKVLKHLINTELGRRIISRREAMGLSRQALSGLIKKSYEALSKIENSKTQPHESTVRKIAEVLKCSIAYLKGETDSPELPEMIKEPGVSYGQQHIFRFNVPIEFRLSITNTSLFVEIIEKGGK